MPKKPQDHLPPKETPVTYPVPQLAQTALQLAHRDFQDAVNAIGRQAVQALGLDPDKYDYQVNFDAGVITRGKKIEKPARETV